MPLLIHSLALLSAILVLPGAFVFLLLRPRHLRGLGDRLGSVAKSEANPIWIHGASVGESVAAVRLLTCLEERGHSCFASATTSSGLQILRDTAPSVPSVLAPLDHPWCVERALSRVRPGLLVLIETEIWPVWILGAKRRGIPVLVVSGRISDRSWPRYQRLRKLFTPVLESIDGVSARSELDAERFISLGVSQDRVRVGGDLKLDPGPKRSPLSADLAHALSGKVVFVAGSTHPGEEEAALRAVEVCEAQGIELALVIASRHSRRHAEVESLLRKTGRRIHIRSSLQGEVVQNGEVLLLDSFGELAGLYAVASVAFVGGTIAPIGGHNLLEPLFEGCSVLFGPHVENTREMAKLAEATGAGVQFDDRDAFGPALLEMLSDLSDLRARGAKAQTELLEHRGSTERLASWVAARAGSGDGRIV